MAANPVLAKEVWIPQLRTFYRAQFREMIMMNRAHGKMLVKQGLLSAEDWAAIHGGLERVESGLAEEDLCGELNDLYFNIMNRLYDEIGEDIGSKLHIGRSRNDMGCACNRMQVRRELLSLMEEAEGLMALLLELAERQRDTVIPYYTFGQPAQPGTYGHYLMLAFQLLSRDYKRLQAAYGSANLSPLGAAAGIGTSYVLDPQYTAELLGFDGVIPHSLDAVSSPDYLLEAEAAMAIMLTNVGKLAQDLFSWAGYGCQILDCDDSIASRSSIMPQKKNPELLERVRAQASRAAGMLSEALTLAHNTTLFPNIESSVDLFYDFALILPEIKKALSLLKAGLEHSTVRAERAYRLTRDSFTAASAMAEALAMERGISFTSAHHIVAGAINRLMGSGELTASRLSGRLLEEVSAEVLGSPIPISHEEAQALADPRGRIAAMATGGTPRPEDMDLLLSLGRQTLLAQESWRTKQAGRIAGAYGRLSGA